MKTSWFKMTALMALAMCSLTACATDDELEKSDSAATEKAAADEAAASDASEDATAGSAVLSTAADGDVQTFTITTDSTPLAETLVVDAGDDDYVENTEIGKTIYITYSGSGVTVEGDDAGIVSVSGGYVTATNTSSVICQYILSGTTSNGNFKLYSSKKSIIQLAGVNITNPSGPAINNQSKKRTFVILADGTSNTLTDGTSYTAAVNDEDQKACFFSEGQLIFSGTGALSVDANCKAGIRSDDYVRFMPGCNVEVDASAGNGIRGNDAVIVTGGVLNVTVSASGSKAISTDSIAQFDGGRTTLITTGAAVWDSDEKDFSGVAGVKADQIFRMNDGELNIKSSGKGAKGISCDGEITLNGGQINIITTGSTVTYGSEDCDPKGVKADGDLYLQGTHLKVRCANSEAVESKGTLYIKSGIAELWGSDDCINSKRHMYISGGCIYAHATNNDAIDSNGNLYIQGGVIVAEGAGQPENALDAAEGYAIYITGGTVVARGGSNAAVTATSGSQACVTGSVTLGSTSTLFSGSTPLVTWQVPNNNTQSKALLISMPSLKSGSAYTLQSGVSTSSGTWFYGVSTDCSVSGGSSSTTLTASASVSGSGMGGNPFGGGGGRW